VYGGILNGLGRELVMILGDSILFLLQHCSSLPCIIRHGPYLVDVFAGIASCKGIMIKFVLLVIFIK
jgi:hypothetical protein